ncbi:MAG TPA: hypothetical protein VFB06_12035 [Streptosporangiaceae bacterium]|nr:hypothetical protein [Streptosporangiaceae bacterium]
MFVQMCLKGIRGITLADAKAILGGRGLACGWWRNARHITSAEIDERLTEAELDLHVNAFESQHPTRPGRVMEETPFISLTAGSVERHKFLAKNEIHPAHEIAMNFGTDFGRYGECFVFYCWVLVGMRPSAAVRHLAEEVRELNTYPPYSRFQLEGEIAAKIAVPARQIKKFEHYEYRKGRLGKPQFTCMGTYDNPDYVEPHGVTNYRDWLT